MSLKGDPLLTRLTSPLALGVLLAVAVVALFWPATGFEFSHFDDLTYYAENEHVQAGLSWSGIVWAFCTGTASNWHPLTWVSLMMDADIGSGAKDTWMPHFTNILFHGLNSALLFWVFWSLTIRPGIASPPGRLKPGLQTALQTSDIQHAKARITNTVTRQAEAWTTNVKWRCFLVAGLFAVHPLNVESVAWVAERKSVLSMFFFLLCLLAYVRAVADSRINGLMDHWIFGIFSPSPIIRRSSHFFWLALLLFALALMSKPMVVTLPFVLLLLDFWPLKRVTSNVWQVTRIKQLLIEKIPFFLLAVGDCVVTYLVQQHGHAVQTAEHFPLAERIENAFVSYARYLGRTFWPVHLAVYYPHPGQWPAAVWCLAGALVVAVSLITIWCGRKFPYLPMGWFWFLGTLVPMIGLVQAGTQSMADRYAYLPLIGIFIAAVWVGFELVEWVKLPRAVCFMAGGIILVTSTVAARHQLNFWQNDGALFGHALAVTKNNVQAEVTYGVYLEKINQPAEAARHYRAALAIDPNEKNAHFNLGNILDDEGKTEEAIQEYRAAIKADPEYYPAPYNLALVLERIGRREEAIGEYKAVLQIKPDFAPAKQHLQGLGVGN